jgi:tetratricopeptide (TPR) repeat protein
MGGRSAAIDASGEDHRGFNRMATKRKVVKKDIKKDPLVTYALKTSQYAQEHFNQVIIGVVVLIALIAVVVFTANSRRGAAVQSERQLSQAIALFQQQDFTAAKVSFSQIVDRHGGRSAAIARYYKAECEFLQRNYSQAALDYQSYLDTSSDFPEFKAAALYGAGICYEAAGNHTAAATTMEQVHHSVDENDPRYLDSAFRAGENFAKVRNIDRAVEYFQIVADKGSGKLKDKATVALALIDIK